MSDNFGVKLLKREDELNVSWYHLHFTIIYTQEFITILLMEWLGIFPFLGNMNKDVNEYHYTENWCAYKRKQKHIKRSKIMEIK